MLKPCRNVERVENVVREASVLTPTCDILLSVFGEAPFLRRFLESLHAQRWCGWRLIYRFDGNPTERVLALLAEVQGAIEIPGRKSLGVVGSYRALLKASTASHFCTADQDDIWHDDKLAVLMDAMLTAEARLGRTTPVLVHSDLRVVDVDCGEIAPSFVRYQSLDPRRCSLRDLLVQNNVTGCAMMGNRALLTAAGELPDSAICHDWYLALVAAAFGEIRFVERQLVDYRQHGGNVYGACPRKRLFSRGFQRARLHDRLVATQRQAQAFLRQHRDRLTGDRTELVEAWARLADEPSWYARMRTLARCGFRKNDVIRTLGMIWAI